MPRETESECAPGSCGPGCCHAGVLPDTFGEWIWCDRPDAEVRLVREGRPCAWFGGGSAHGARLPKGTPR